MKRGSALVLSVAVISGLVWLAALDPAIGEAYDDGHYITLARSLASGRGFSQIQVPGDPAEAQYPPGWPLMLAPVWLVAPVFPSNAVAFKIVSVLCGIGVVVCTYRWMCWQGENEGIAALVASLTALNPLVFGYATSAFSEMAYMLFALVALWLTERYARLERPTLFDAVVASLAVAMTVYVRTIGVSLVVAAFLFLLARRQLRRAGILGLLCLILTAPWFLRGLVLPQESWTYSQQFLLRSMEQPELGLVSIGELAVRVVLNVRAYLLAGMPGALFPSQVPLTFVNLAEGLRVGSPVPGMDIFLALLIVGGLIGRIVFRRAVVDWYVLVYLMIALAWPWEPTRFVVPIIPFLYGYLTFELTLLAMAFWRFTRFKLWVRAIALGLATLWLAANGLTQVRYAVSMRQVAQKSSGQSARTLLYDWIDHHVESGRVLAAMNDYQLYLYTARPVVRNFGTLEALGRQQVDYVVLVPYGGVMLEGDLSRKMFEPVYRTRPDLFDSVYEDGAAGIQVYRVRRELLSP